MRRTAIIGSSTLLLLITCAATAAPQDLLNSDDDRGPVVTLHDNGEPDLVNGYSNNARGSVRLLLDDFVVPQDDAWFVEGMRWWHVQDSVFTGGPAVDLVLKLRHDDAGAPGPAFAEIEIDMHTVGTINTGRILFNRPEEVSWVEFDPIMLRAGHYWWEAAVERPENEGSYWLTASPIQHSECWVNYEDLCGFCPGSEQFGSPADLSWRLEGRDSAGPAACCLPDGQCFEMELADCDDAGGMYQGRGIDCSPPLCSAPRACCFTDGTCETETEHFCTAMGGFFAGLGTSCATFECSDSGFCLTPAVTYATDSGSTGALALGDLDGKNGPDVVHGCGTSSSCGLRVRLNDGSGGFLASSYYDTVHEVRDIAIADLDGDFDLDLAVVSRGDGVVAIHLNDGTGTIGPRVEYPVSNEPSTLAIGDLDGDLDGDLVIAGSEDHVLVLFNDGAGGFGPATAYDMGSSTSGPAIGDLDGDLDNDLVVAVWPLDRIAILFNQGNGTFAPYVVRSTAERPRDVHAHDLDGDGDLDLALPGYVSDQVSVFLNNGDGTFGPDTRYDVGERPGRLAIVERRNLPFGDIAVVNQDHDVTILVNDGHGGFSGYREMVTGTTPGRIVAGDLDGDLDVDLALGYGTSGLIIVFKECLTCPGDLDHSGAVDFGDILRILGAWGMSGGPEDLDGSGFVDFGDLLFVLGAWGACG